MTSWPADHVERRPVAGLVPYARNARTHSAEQVKQLAASIKEWGWTSPALVDEQGRLIAGHGRVLAAKELGLDQIPVMVARGWTEAQIQAYRLADNQLAINAGWDADLLKVELGDLKLAGFDLDLVGFGDVELAGFMADRNDGLTDPDEVPDPPADPVSRLGDVWVLGRHRLACGDSTDAAMIDALMQGDLADLCFTSPPYRKQRDYKNPISDWLALMKGVFAAAPLSEPAQLLVNLGLVHHDGEWLPYWDPWLAWMREQHWRTFGWYVWDQGPGLPGDWNGRLAPSHEFIFHLNRIAERARKTKNSKMAGVISNGGLRNKDGSIDGRSKGASAIQKTKIPDSVVRVMRHKGGLGAVGKHPAIFPVDLAQEIITAFSDPGDIVFEPFSGSGSQIIAAEKTGRDCRAVELAGEYADVAVRRWEAFTGELATHQETGRTFAELAADRGVVLPDRQLAGAA